MLWAIDSIPAEILQKREIDECQINFNMESKLSDEITINTSELNPDTFYVEGVSTNSKNIFQATIKLKQ